METLHVVISIERVTPLEFFSFRLVVLSLHMLGTRVEQSLVCLIVSVFILYVFAVSGIHSLT